MPMDAFPDKRIAKVEQRPGRGRGWQRVLHVHEVRVGVPIAHVQACHEYVCHAVTVTVCPGGDTYAELHVWRMSTDEESQIESLNVTEVDGGRR
jgi:hypothetical protein